MAGQRARVAGVGWVSRARLYSFFCNKHWRNKELYHSSTINKSDYSFFVVLFCCVVSCSWYACTGTMASTVGVVRRLGSCPDGA